MRIGVLQINPKIGDLDFNFNLICESISIGLQQKISFFITPELALIGYPPKDFLSLRFILKKQNDLLKKIVELSAEKNFSIIVGGIEKNTGTGKPFFNSAFVVSRGKMLGTYRKQRLPAYDVFEDERFFESGESVCPLFEVDHFKFRIAICEDLWNHTQAFGIRDIRSYSKDSNPFLSSKDSLKDTSLLIHLTASPYWISKIETRFDLISALAQKTQCPIVSINQVGAQDELIFDGRSFVANSQGDIAWTAPSFKQGIFDFDTDHLKNVLNRTAESHWNNLFAALSLGIVDYVRKSNFEKVHLGLSGGIDSALVATLCTHALGAKNILGVLLPSSFTSNQSMTDAHNLCENLLIHSRILKISPLVSLTTQALQIKEHGLTYENLQSRIRGLLLLGISNSENSLLITTGNKSEIAMGYATLYGDMCGALSPIGDLYKTEVFGLCHWINQNFSSLGFQKAPIPGSTLARAPTAELAPEQKDEDSLPPYEILDGLLYELIENQGETIFQAPAWNSILKPRHSVEKILKQISKSEFKRNQSAPILKTHLRSFGKNWRFPVVTAPWQVSPPQESSTK